MEGRGKVKVGRRGIQDGIQKTKDEKWIEAFRRSLKIWMKMEELIDEIENSLCVNGCCVFCPFWDILDKDGNCMMMDLAWKFGKLWIGKKIERRTKSG